MSIEDKGNKETCTDVINISGSFIEVREEKIESLPKGTYLFIESAGKKNYIPIDDFKNLDPRIGKQRSAILSTDPDVISCLLYTSPSPRDATLSRMPSSA